MKEAKMYLTSSLFFVTMVKMDNAAPQIPNTIPSQNSNISKRVIMVILIVVILSGIIGYMIGIKSIQNQSTAQPIQTILSPTSAIISPTISQNSVRNSMPTTYEFHPSVPTIYQWQPYIRGQFIANVGVAINYPQGWTVRLNNLSGGNYPPDMSAYRLSFDFLPPGVTTNPQSVNWMGWGGMYIDVSDKISNGDIHQYVSDMFVTKIQQEIVISPAVVGNKQAYYLTAPSDPGFAPRYVILGSNYSYDLGFNQNGVNGFMEKIKSDIFPTIVFN